MSELDLYAKYLDLGVRLGKSGEDLATWVEDKVRQDMERSERQIERERKREEMELQKQREEMELQRHREEREMQKVESQRQLEFRRLELEAETKKLELGSRNNADGAGPRPSYATQRPKISPLNDPSQIDLYLERFKRHATAFGWHESEWASCLSNLLQDEALSIFLSLSPAEGADYQAVKRVLLQRFGCDGNGFRSRFLSVKPQEAEDFGTFINRARRYFDRWVELSGVTTLEGLSYLVCSEIALQACDEDFVAYVKDRSPADMVSLKTVASAYMDARPNKSFRGNSLFLSLPNLNLIVPQYVLSRREIVAVFGLDLMVELAGVIILQKGTDRPVFRVALMQLREVLLVHPPGTEINLILLARMLARVILNLVRAVVLV
ncbi:reverse transcriptase [Plakobranchus ocellatus]|uniref:Reverse transcriptase n=1 Tax=Plakobranchus ocellatus TaxID=259542 RepID=A0AAV3XU76_9GAST|nr:reverse transcriptase [Plakobranchus ocellatus]